MRKLILLATILIISTTLVFAQKQDNSLGNNNENQQVTLLGGYTSVALSSDFAGALNSLNIQARRAFPGSLVRGNAVFPITSGTLETDTLRGEILHSGGLKLIRDNTEVKLQNFIIDTTGDSIILTGLVSVNGNVVGRIPLFDLQLTSNFGSWRIQLKRIRLSNVLVTLRPEAAEALNGVFETEAFVAGFSIGTARVRGISFVD